MSRVVRRQVERLPDGKVLSETIHEAFDDPNGGTEVRHHTRYARCPTCTSGVGTSSDLRPRCQRCGKGPMCSHCHVSCEGCRRDVCPRCRGVYVWAGRPLVVCRVCRAALNRRAAIEQRMQLGREGFRRFTTKQAIVTRLREQAYRRRMDLLRLLNGSATPARAPRPRGGGHGRSR